MPRSAPSPTPRSGTWQAVPHGAGHAAVPTDLRSPERPLDLTVLDAADPVVGPAQVAEAMWRDDAASQSLGMNVLEVRGGFARVAMPVRPDMVGCHGVCHAGMIFALAETAFAYATNGGNQLTLAAGAAIDYLAPARLGELLLAEAEEHWTSARTGITDVVVTGAGGRRIAIFRGRASRLGAAVV